VHGADVLLISGSDLPAIPWLTIDTVAQADNFCRTQE